MEVYGAVGVLTETNFRCVVEKLGVIYLAGHTRHFQLGEGVLPKMDIQTGAIDGLGGGYKRDRTADLLNAMASGGGQNEYIWIK